MQELELPFYLNYVWVFWQSLLRINVNKNCLHINYPY